MKNGPRFDKEFLGKEQTNEWVNSLYRPCLFNGRSLGCDAAGMDAIFMLPSEFSILFCTTDADPSDPQPEFPGTS